MVIPYLACMLRTAAFYRLPPRLLPAIQAVEGGRVGTIHPNRDGSADLGPMQINTRWLPALAAVTGLPPATVRALLLHDPCFNVAAAGAILRRDLALTRGRLMLAVGDYHSATPALNRAYRAEVRAAAQRLFGRHIP